MRTGEEMEWQGSSQLLIRLGVGWTAVSVEVGVQREGVRGADCRTPRHGPQHEARARLAHSTEPLQPMWREEGCEWRERNEHERYGRRALAERHHEPRVGTRRWTKLGEMSVEQKVECARRRAEHMKKEREGVKKAESTMERKRGKDAELQKRGGGGSVHR